ncbi:hypothetical protein C2857_005061 [Epichloe festucae Fl1]|uniref:Uncharacterized protein n=1 Tax=Epichloe festucae (strain Fl1) TaxID=877507 RepID=A0A7S9PTT9_EPIFF|nr:hypothetical protein C2857_005061 [Epichloe festucae Fl1]
MAHAHGPGPDASGATTHAASFQGAPGIIIPQQQAMPDVQLDSSHFINGGWDTGGFDDIGAADFELQLESSPCWMQDLPFDHVAHASPTVEHVTHDESTAADTDDDTPPSRGSCAASSALMTVGNIFHEIANLNHQRLDSANLCDTKLLHEALFGMQPPRSPHDGQEGCMPLRRVFDVTVRFVWALQTMNPVACGTGLARPSPPALSVQLMVLSTYLELGQLLDRFLTRMHDDHASHRRLANCGQRASRHGTMLAQVIEHQMHSIERLIGLPEEFRLWSRQDSYVGILDQDRPSELALAVMGQAKGTFTSLKQTMDRITTAPE